MKTCLNLDILEIAEGVIDVDMAEADGDICPRQGRYAIFQSLDKKN